MRTALCTNNVREWEPLWRSKLPELDEVFEVVVDSAFVGSRKPERAIYNITLERLGGVKPQECVFVDDIDVNCEGARELGMHPVRFEETSRAIAEVEALLSSGG
jgi:putative hydrolase of the HAD superfamily